MIKTTFKKMYSITFNRYTSYLRDCVSTDDHNVKDIKYLKLPHNKEPFLIAEDEIEYYKQFGGGIKNQIFVGYIRHVEVTIDDKNNRKRNKTNQNL